MTNPPPTPQVPSLEPSEVVELIASGAALIDIREPQEWEDGHIKGAKLKPMSTINDWYEELPRDRQVILYCRTGSRSARVAHALIEQAGFDNVSHLQHGITGWALEGLEVESGS